MMTPRQRADMERLKLRVRLLERHRNLVSKAALDRLIWLVNEIEAKPKGERWIRIALSASDGRLLRRIVDGLLDPKESK